MGQQLTDVTEVFDKFNVGLGGLEQLTGIPIIADSSVPSGRIILVGGTADPFTRRRAGIHAILINRYNDLVWEAEFRKEVQQAKDFVNLKIQHMFADLEASLGLR